LGSWPVSVSNRQETCRSGTSDAERLLSYSANAYFVPKAVSDGNWKLPSSGWPRNQKRPLAIRNPVSCRNGRCAVRCGHWLRRLWLRHPARCGRSPICQSSHL